MLLLVRPDDLVVLGVDWSGFQLDGSRLQAVSEPALLTALFPPQHLAEEVTGNSLARAQLSGTSQVVYRVAVGTVIDLTVDGFLEALGKAEVQEQTTIELPWGLLLSPAAARPAIIRPRRCGRTPPRTSACGVPACPPGKYAPPMPGRASTWDSSPRWTVLIGRGSWRRASESSPMSSVWN